MIKTYICLISDLIDGVLTPMQIGINDFNLLVFKLGNKIIVCQRSCPHGKAPLDVVGKIVGDDVILCTKHKIAFCLVTGASLRPKPKCKNLQIYKTQIIDEQVYAWLPDDFDFNY